MVVLRKSSNCHSGSREGAGSVVLEEEDRAEGFGGLGGGPSFGGFAGRFGLMRKGSPSG